MRRYINKILWVFFLYITLQGSSASNCNQNDLQPALERTEQLVLAEALPLDRWRRERGHSNPNNSYEYPEFTGHVEGLGNMHWPRTVYRGGTLRPGAHIQRAAELLGTHLPVEAQLGFGGYNLVYHHPHPELQNHFVIRIAQNHEHLSTSSRPLSDITQNLHRQNALEHTLPQHGIDLVQIIHTVEQLQIAHNPQDATLSSLIHRRAQALGISPNQFLTLLAEAGIFIQRRSLGETLGVALSRRRHTLDDFDTSPRSVHLIRRPEGRRWHYSVGTGDVHLPHGAQIYASGTALPRTLDDRIPQAVVDFFENLRRIDIPLARAQDARLGQNLAHELDESTTLFSRPAVEGVDIGDRTAHNPSQRYGNCHFVDFLVLLARSVSGTVTDPRNGNVYTRTDLPPQGQHQAVICFDW